MATTSIRIMVYRHSAFYSPLLATMAAGFLAGEGLSAEYFIKPKERSLYEMFERREVDIMQAAVSTSWDPLSKGRRDIPLHFAQINQRDGFFIAGRGERAFEWKDLEGSSLIADYSQQPLAMLKYALHRQGVDWSRIRALNAGAPDQMVEAFRRGEGDFLHAQGAVPQQLEFAGECRVLACVGDAMPPVAFSSLMALPAFLETAVADKFVRAYRRALNWVNDTPAADIAAAETGFFEAISPPALSAAIAAYQRLGTWRRDPTIPRDQYDVAMDVFVFNGIFRERFDYHDVVYNRAFNV